MKKEYRRFLRYVLVSIAISIINVILYLILVSSLNYMHVLANVLSWGMSTLLLYFLNKKIIFKSTNDEKRINLKKIIYFYLVRVTSLIIDTLVLKFCIDFLGINYVIAKIISNCSTVFNNYFISKSYVFK